jgi:hypothetical protein
VTYYNHLAVQAQDDPGECRVCGVRVIGLPDDLKHEDETIRTIAVDREYLVAVRAATDAVALALSKVTERATDQERARVAAVAIYGAGLLRKRPAPTPR